MRDRIVVGVDGSEERGWPSSGPSRRHDCATPHSLAVTRAATRDGCRCIRRAFEIDPELITSRGRRKQLLERELAAVDTWIEVESLVEPRNAADALLDAARDAGLLGVGTRGHGGFKTFCWLGQPAGVPPRPARL